MSTKAPILIDKVKWDGVRCRIEYQARRPDNRYDELAFASFDRPSPEFCQDLQALERDICGIGELPESYTQGLMVRGVSFSYTDGVMGACITGLKRVKSAKSPLVLNTPFITESGINEGDQGPFLTDETVERLSAVAERAIRYIEGGERAQGELDLEKPGRTEPPSGDIAAASALRMKDIQEYARLTGMNLAEAITDPNNPAVRQFAEKFRNCSFEVAGRRLEIDGDGNITAHN